MPPVYACTRRQLAAGVTVTLSVTSSQTVTGHRQRSTAIILLHYSGGVLFVMGINRALSGYVSPIHVQP